ncbi:hypothetical protein Tco_0471669 [Tanacetum coccineum]
MILLISFILFLECKGNVHLDDMIDDLEMRITYLENQFDSYRIQKLGKKDMKTKGKEKMETKGKEKMIEDETVADKEVWDNIKFTDEQINKLKEKYGLGHMKIIDEQINEFLDDMFNQKKKELLLIKGKKLKLLKGCFVSSLRENKLRLSLVLMIILKMMHCLLVIVKLMRVNTKDDAFSVSVYEDDESEADDDTDVMWVVPYKSHASTSKVSKFKEQKGKRKKNSSEVNKPTNDFKRPYSEVRITYCVLGLTAPRSVVGCSSSKNDAVGCSSSKKGAVGCSSTKQTMYYGSWHVTWKGVRQMVSTG